MNMVNRTDINDTIRELINKNEIWIGTANPDYYGVCGWLPKTGPGYDRRQETDDNPIQLCLGYWHSAPLTSWEEQATRQVRDAPTDPESWDTPLSQYDDGHECALEGPDNESSRVEYDKGLTCSCGEPASVQFIEGDLHTCAYHAGFLIGAAKHDMKIMRAALGMDEEE
jgi:hypothetical protein